MKRLGVMSARVLARLIASNDNRKDAGACDARTPPAECAEARGLRASEEKTTAGLRNAVGRAQFRGEDKLLRADEDG